MTLSESGHFKLKRSKKLLQKFLASFFINLFILILLPSSLHGQSFNVMWWNVENLFDTSHDSLKHDEEFMPEAMRHWHYGRYKKKLDDIATVIVSAGQWEIPALIGLCEVENDSVLIDLTRYSALRSLGYRYVMTHSNDVRGIDVALLYQRDQFKLLQKDTIRVSCPHHRPTRDLLHVAGQLISGDTLDVLLAHFPSRAGGSYKQSEPYRLLVAQALRQEADRLMQHRQHPLILIMGDFNDYPTNRSVTKILQAKAPPTLVSPHQLYHLLARQARHPDIGTYKYKGQWGLLDHIIVSGALLQPQSPLYTNEKQAEIAQLPILLKDDTTYGGRQPFRTYIGLKYQGGISDHLPLLLHCRITIKP